MSVYNNLRRTYTLLFPEGKKHRWMQRDYTNDEQTKFCLAGAYNLVAYGDPREPQNDQTLNKVIEIADDSVEFFVDINDDPKTTPKKMRAYVKKLINTARRLKV